jgi:hypothetical protein
LGFGSLDARMGDQRDDGGEQQELLHQRTAAALKLNATYARSSMAWGTAALWR